MNRRWVCSDVWFDTFPFFDRPQLGFKLALLSPRFDVLVDKYFDCKRELTIWRKIMISKDSGQSWSLLRDFLPVRYTATPKLSVCLEWAKFMPFPLPNHSLHSKICFKSLEKNYIDHSVIAFLRANQKIWDKDTYLVLSVPYAKDDQPIWRVFVREIWPIFAQNIRHLGFFGDGIFLDNLCRFISPTILSDLNINSIFCFLFPDATDDFDGPNAIPTAGQMLSKWLHTPTKDGQPKRLHCYLKAPNIEWANTLKKKFLTATTSASYKIQFDVNNSLPIVPFELANKRTKEKLTLIKTMEHHQEEDRWIMKRCQNCETEVQ